MLVNKLWANSICASHNIPTAYYKQHLKVILHGKELIEVKSTFRVKVCLSIGRTVLVLE